MMYPFPHIPATLGSTREALHRLATYVIAPTRHRATERFGLRSTPPGFGTPPFDGRQIRVEGSELVDDQAGETRRQPITTLTAAAQFLHGEIDTETAAEHDSPAVGDTHADLGVDAGASLFLGAWYEMAFTALQAVGAEDGSVDASEAQLWPGHFDAAIEIGDEDHRASYGASAGDHAIDEPYLYVSVWWPDKIGIDTTDPIWNSESFVGAMLKLSDFPDDDDPVEVAASFWRRIRDAIG
ncbi:MAG: hypothetical protein ACR2P0_05080 [Acidimicrobiales bacterium]